MSDAPYLGRTLKDALQRVEYDRETLPQIVQVEPSDYDRIILAEEIARLEKLVEVAGIIFRHNLTPDKGNNYFICGEQGPKDNCNMPDKIHVCPAYGLDFFYVYEYTGETHGTEW